MTVESRITVVVLTSGISRRLGRDKTAVPFHGETLINRVMRRASAAAGSADVVTVIANDERKDPIPADIPHRLVVDAYPGSGTLGGIYTGLEAALVAACDMPFLSAPLLRYMTGLRDGVEAVVPGIGERPEDLAEAIEIAARERNQSGCLAGAPTRRG